MILEEPSRRFNNTVYKTCDKCSGQYYGQDWMMTCHQCAFAYCQQINDEKAVKRQLAISEGLKRWWRRRKQENSQ